MSNPVESVSASPVARDPPAHAAPAVRADAPAGARAEAAPVESGRAAAGAQTRPVRARLTYDREESRTVVEVLDPRTGKVLYRFPPERVEEHRDALARKEPGALYDQVA